MELLRENISILNWVEPRFSLQDLHGLRQIGPSLTEKQLRKLLLKKESLKDLYQLIDNLYLSLKRGAHLLCCLDPGYPEELKAMLSCPVPLMYRGHLNFDHFNLSVVGSRRPGKNSLDWLKEDFYQGLLELKRDGKSLSVLSGGAYGTDQSSHRIALLSATPTVCFLPSGINELYPPNIEPMINQIEEEGGAVISPFSPNFPIFKSNFYYRNRILVLLSDLVFVVEARRRSGTMMTANLAAKLGKPVIVLPQSPSVSSMGGLDLIGAGAPMVTCKKDLLFQVSHTSCSKSPQYDLIL